MSRKGLMPWVKKVSWGDRMPLDPTAKTVMLEFWQGSAVVQLEPPEAVVPRLST